MVEFATELQLSFFLTATIIHSNNHMAPSSDFEEYVLGNEWILYSLETQYTAAIEKGRIKGDCNGMWTGACPNGTGYRDASTQLQPL